MSGRKTHEQQLRTIEERVNTKNADEDFDARADLERSPEAREAFRKGRDLKPENTPSPETDDRSMTRGRNQESRHNKPGGE